MSMPGLDDGGSIGRTALDSLTVSLNLRPGPVGTPAPEVVEAVRRLTGFRLPHDREPPITWQQFDGEARACYARIKALDGSGQQLRLFLAYLSGYFHELRHAHDLLVTTYGQDALFLLLNVYQNLPALLSRLAQWQAQGPGRLIPLPVRGRESLLQELSEDVAAVISKYADVDERLQALQEPPASSPQSLTVVHLLEATATDVQMDFLHELFGEEGVYEFTRLLLEGKRAPLYLQIRTYAQDIFAARGYHGPGLGSKINYLAWCALMGLTPRGSKLTRNVYPAVLFEGLIEHVSRRCHEADWLACRQAVHEYCDRWHLHYPEEMVQRYRNVVRKRLESLAALPRTPSYAGARKIGGCYRALARAYDIMHEHMGVHPELYFVGRNYAWNFLAGQLPAVFVRLHLNGSSHDFVTAGTQFLSQDRRLLLDLLATTMRLLLKGRGQTADPIIEDVIFRQLTERGWDGHRFEFDAFSGFG